MKLNFVSVCLQGAARRLNSPLKNIEIESIAEPKNRHQPSDSHEKLYFRNEVSICLSMLAN